MLDNTESECWLDRPLEEPCKKNAPLKLVENYKGVMARAIEDHDKIVFRPRPLDFICGVKELQLTDIR